MGIEHEKAEDQRIFNLSGRLQFQDRAPDDPPVGPARMVDITGRCADCWGGVVALVDGNGRWIRIACRVCGRRVDAEDAEQELKRMIVEAKRNIPSVRVGHGAVYHEKAKFVLKILPDMDRNKAEFEKRVDAARRTAQSKWKRKRCLTRREFAKMGTPGYLYLQACALVSGLGALPRKVSAVSLSDFDFENLESKPSGPKVDGLNRVQLSAQLPLKPSTSEQMVERMGTAIITGFAAAFACEVGMKAILMTRRDEAKMTHDLLELHNSLPDDCQERLQADFPGIADTFRKYRHAFGNRRYLEPSTSEDAILALIDTDRIWGLERAARVIVDEGLIVGLQYDINLRYQFVFESSGYVNEDNLTFTIAPDDAISSTKVSIEISGHESAISWDAILLLRSSYRNPVSPG